MKISVMMNIKNLHISKIFRTENEWHQTEVTQIDNLQNGEEELGFQHHFMNISIK